MRLTLRRPADERFVVDFFCFCFFCCCEVWELPELCFLDPLVDPDVDAPERLTFELCLELRPWLPPLLPPRCALASPGKVGKRAIAP